MATLPLRLAVNGQAPGPRYHFRTTSLFSRAMRHSKTFPFYVIQPMPQQPSLCFTFICLVINDLPGIHVTFLRQTVCSYKQNRREKEHFVQPLLAAFISYVHLEYRLGYRRRNYLWLIKLSPTQQWSDEPSQLMLHELHKEPHPPRFLGSGPP